MTGLDEVKLINLPKILDERGNLSFFEEGNQIPFEIKRVYWIYDVPGGQVRGGHAFKLQNEFIISLSGSFDVNLNDGKQEVRYSLNRSYTGLYIPQGIWRNIENFSSNALCLIAANTEYMEDDYIRDFEAYKTWLNEK
jgi:dTDP-4-dehydrorhamnose 3,5-epimerase-like enzyme